MANVLPLQERAALRRNYWLRLATVFAFVLTAAMLIGVVSLVPAYLLARAEFNEITRYQELQGETQEAAKRDNAVQTARLVNAQIKELKETQAHSAVTAVESVMRDWNTHAENIIISGFNYSLEQEKKIITPELRVSGEARDRAALNAFVQTLRADSDFTNVSFPVSDLAGGDTVDFSLTVSFESL